ncbi:MAG TPA: HAD family hydrolase [Firmicutes bacterium]|nr:HAD family hydrolase [Bacillota bacterium]
MKNTILFDLDGTLLDTLTDLTASVNYALSRVGLPARSRDEVRSFLGDGYKVLMEKACGGADSADALKYFTEYYAVHLEDNTAPYPGVTDALAALAAKGRKMAVVSNKGYDAVQVLCGRFFAPHVTLYYGVSDTLKKKPAPDMLLAAMRDLHSDAEDCVMVGDGEPDIAMARAAGIDIISVTWGFRTKEQLEKAGGTVFLDKTKMLAEL